MKRYIFWVITILCASCGHSGKPAHRGNSSGRVADTAVTYTSDTLGREYQALYDSVEAYMSGSALSEPLTNFRLFNFSSRDTADTFRLFIPKGLLATSKAVFSIKKKDGNTIFADTFGTATQVSAVFYLDFDYTGKTDRQIMDHIRGITAQEYIAFLHSSVSKFFDSLFIARDEIKKIADGLSIGDSALYNQVVEDDKIKVMFVPDYDAGEGACWYAYSSVTGKAEAIACVHE